MKKKLNIVVSNIESQKIKPLKYGYICLSSGKITCIGNSVFECECYFTSSKKMYSYLLSIRKMFNSEGLYITVNICNG